MTSFSIDKFKINSNSSPFIIAELSANHNGNIKNIFKLIDLAKESKADAVKIQTYTADSMTINSKRKEFYLKKGLWKGKYLYDLYTKGSTPLEWHERIFNYAKKKKILCFSTPFDINAVNSLSKLNVPAFKVASYELTDIPLIAAISRTRKPMIISTGMASIQDIDLALLTAKKNGAKNISLLHCVSNYPSDPKDYNLNFIPKLINKYKVVVGLSDHTLGSVTAISAIPLGARIIEKHIKLPNQKSLDSDFSMDTNQFVDFVKAIKLSHLALGNKNFNRDISEKDAKLYRRSIFISQNVKKNEKITKDNIRVVRPAYGLHPVYYKYLLGKKFKLNLEKGTALKFKHISNIQKIPKLI